VANSFPLPRLFNAADYFVDRNLREDRGSNIAIECATACAIKYDVQRVTYAQLLERVNRVGNALRQLGVRIEERVLLLLLDTPEFAYSFFGAIKIGAVPVPVNTLLRPADYLYLLNDSRARVVIVSESLLPHIQAIPREQLQFLRDIVVVGTAPSGTHAFADLCANASDDLQPAATTADDVAFWLYSSGSTGAPKGCVHLQRDMVVCSYLYVRGVLDIQPQDRCFSVAKLFFAYGLGNALYFPFSVGATSILWPGPPTPANVFPIIERHRPTLFFSVPTAYAQMLHASAPAERDYDLSSIRFGVSAGEALPAAIFQRFQQRFGVTILDGIGSTEITHIFISNRPGDVRPGSSGRLVEGYEARIVDESNVDVKQGEVGNLLIHGDSTCARYWNQEDKTRDTIQGRWIRTGDKYWQDPDGYFWYAGRADDMLKVNGIWVSPVEIESALIAHDAVAECAVIGRNDESGLEKPLACVVLKNATLNTEAVTTEAMTTEALKSETTASAALARELQDWVKTKLPSFKSPRWIEFVTELPKTATGKLQRYKLREQRHREGTLAKFLANSPLRDSDVKIRRLNLHLHKDEL
jgi:benzoate-CoA ligase